jgi:hypothetical protein
VTNAQIVSIERLTQIGEKTSLSHYWLAQFLMIKLRLGNTLCNSMIVCLLNSLVGGPS